MHVLQFFQKSLQKLYYTQFCPAEFVSASHIE